MAKNPDRSAYSENAEADRTPQSAAAGTHELTPEDRDQQAAKLVDRFAMWSAAGGLIPVPIVDWVAVGGIQIHMLRKLSEIYGVPFSENRGKALMTSLAGAWIPATSAMGVASMFKFVPIIGTLASAFAMPALSAGATYAIGKAFVEHFKSGGTLLDFNPPKYREFMEAQKAKWESRRAGAPSRTGGPAGADPAENTRTP
jgi:uncharacterized protein (DUF697 family)